MVNFWLVPPRIIYPISTVSLGFVGMRSNLGHVIINLVLAQTQRGHTLDYLTGFSPVCFLMCSVRLFLDVSPFPHSGHSN